MTEPQERNRKYFVFFGGGTNHMCISYDIWRRSSHTETVCHIEKHLLRLSRCHTSSKRDRMSQYWASPLAALKEEDVSDILE